MNITVVGGTYNETCFEPQWNETFGSGLRACRCLMALDADVQVSYNTFVQSTFVSFLESYKHIFPNFSFAYQKIEKNISFYYDHPLGEPRVYPIIDSRIKERNKLTISAENIIQYGMMEGSAEVHGKQIVYDPQSPVDPLPFSATGSRAEKLVYVLNFKEAKSLSGKENLEDVLNHFRAEHSCEAVIIKMDATGAIVQKASGEQKKIPVYKTNKVWTIGSGDVFTASFAYFWFKDYDIFEAAEKASYYTACYCNYSDYQFPTNAFEPLHLTHDQSRQIYLAGPFFTFAQRWLVDQVYRFLKHFNIKVFSPMHHVGKGKTDQVYRKDIAGLESSHIIFAILDGTDTGTLYEVGYASAKKIPAVGFVQNVPADDLLMLNGAKCEMYSDLTTAAYHTYWKLMSL